MLGWLLAFGYEAWALGTRGRCRRDDPQECLVHQTMSYAAQSPQKKRLFLALEALGWAGLTIHLFIEDRIKTLR